MMQIEEAMQIVKMAIPSNPRTLYEALEAEAFTMAYNALDKERKEERERIRKAQEHEAE